MKRPAFQFYPADWRKDPGIQSLSLNDRGAWFEMLCVMHESPRRGYLLLPSGEAMLPKQLARILGISCDKTNLILKRILVSGVASRDELSGAIICRRMVRDEHISAVRRTAGSLGGNPTLVNQTVEQNPTTTVKQKPTPSSSSSSSTTVNTKKGNSPKDKPSDGRHQAFVDWIYQEHPDIAVLPADFKALKTLLESTKNNEAFTVEKLKIYWATFIHAPDQFSRDQGVCLGYFCRNISRFTRSNGNGTRQNNNESATQARERRSAEAAQRVLDAIRSPTQRGLGTGGFFGTGSDVPSGAD